LKSLRGQDSWRRRNICEWSLFKFDANQPVDATPSNRLIRQYFP
jgi:hypothetical protein